MSDDLRPGRYDDASDYEPDCDDPDAADLDSPCPHCEGRGTAIVRTPDGQGVLSVDCPECGGTGYEY